MKNLNEKATVAFAAILDKMQGREYLKLESDPFIPLTVERIGIGIETQYGDGDLYSLCHYYEQNGDMMQDPEMCFLLVDDRDSNVRTSDLLYVLPYSYYQANLGVHQISIDIQDGKIVRFKPEMQSQHTQFANQWLRNIQSQGFLRSIQYGNSI